MAWCSPTDWLNQIWQTKRIRPTFLYTNFFIHVYIINGIEYDTLTAAAEANDCSMITAKNRCTQDKRGKFPDWKCEIR